MNIEFHTIRDFFGPGCGGETGKRPGFMLI